MPDLSKVTAILPDVTDYIVYGAIFIVTLIGFFKCLFPLWRTTGALKHAIRELQDDAGNTTAKPVWQENGFVGKRLKGTWMRFLQNAEQLDRRGLPTNVEDYINDDTVTHGPGNATLAELIPSLLTSLGILGTFMGLSSGLSSLNISDASALIEGIPDLLSGMKFAFGTSVAGISCSLIFNMLNRISQGSSYRTIDDFVSSFTQLAMSRPLDNDVQLICQNQDRNHMLAEVTGSMADRLAENMGTAVSKAMTPVAESMDRFLVGTTRQQIEGIGHIVNNFVREMNSSLNGQFLEMGRIMAAINQNQAVNADTMNVSLRSVQGIVSNAESLQNITDSILKKFDNYMGEISRSNQRDEQFESNAGELLEQMQRNSREQAAALTLIRQYQDEMTRSLNIFREKTGENIRDMHEDSVTAREEMKNAGKSVSDATRDLSRTCEKFAGTVADSFTGSLKAFTDSTQELLNKLDGKLERMEPDGNATSVITSVGEIQRMMTQMENELKTISRSLSEQSKEV